MKQNNTGTWSSISPINTSTNNAIDASDELTTVSNCVYYGGTGDILTSTGTTIYWGNQVNENTFNERLLEKVLDETFTIEEAKKIKEHLLWK